MAQEILIIEDDASLSQPLKEALEAEGFFVTVAIDGGEGLRQALDGNFNALILDINLPAISGLTILDKLRTTDKGKKMAVIILTADDTNEETLMDITKLEPSYYIVKSTVSVAEVVEKVKESIASKAAG